MAITVPIRAQMASGPRKRTSKGLPKMRLHIVAAVHIAAGFQYEWCKLTREEMTLTNTAAA